MSKVNLELREAGSGVLSVLYVQYYLQLFAIYHQPLLALIVAGSLTCAMTVGRL